MWVGDLEEKMVSLDRQRLPDDQKFFVLPQRIKKLYLVRDLQRRERRGDGKVGKGVIDGGIVLIVLTQRHS
jgi:hypothetical protein